MKLRLSWGVRIYVSFIATAHPFILFWPWILAPSSALHRIVLCCVIVWSGLSSLMASGSFSVGQGCFSSATKVRKCVESAHAFSSPYRVQQVLSCILDRCSRAVALVCMNHPILDFLLGYARSIKLSLDNTSPDSKTSTPYPLHPF